MLTTDGFYIFTNVQSSWLAFVRRFYWAYLIRDIHTHRLYRKAMNYVLGIGWSSKTKGVFREIYIPLCVYGYVGKRWKRPFIVSHSFCCSKSLLCSLLLDTLRFISSSAGARQNRGQASRPEKGHPVWLLEFCHPWLLDMCFGVYFARVLYY
jgi:hypothetical protein